jgi:hypothetical protein
MKTVLEILGRRIPQLHASVARVYGPESYLFGVDLSTARFNELCDVRGVGRYDRKQAVMLDGLKLQPEHTLEPNRINAVVAVPAGLEIRQTTLCLEAWRGAEFLTAMTHDDVM